MLDERVTLRLIKRYEVRRVFGCVQRQHLHTLLACTPLDKIQQATGVIRVHAASRSVTVRGLSTEARIDVRGTEVEVEADRAAPLAIYSEGGGSVELTPAAGGYELDAVSRNGSLTIPDDTLQVTTNGDEHRAAGAVHGGGPMITLRSQRADITVRQR